MDGDKSPLQLQAQYLVHDVPPPKLGGSILPYVLAYYPTFNRPISSSSPNFISSFMVGKLFFLPRHLSAILDLASALVPTQFQQG